MPVDIQRAVTRRFWHLHRFVYRASGGRVGQRFFAPKGLAALLLTTIGHRSGQPRSTPLFYLEDGARLVVVASNLGSDQDPAWWRNLQANPGADALLGTRRRRVRAREATPSERAAFWPRFVAAYPGYAGYERRTSRPIPVVVLEPAETSAGG